ncbi:hypothetical protein JOF28_002589 [Leucobacter exalbidus]|uniref:Uncharacterized protein n=1 Tax=Leucobacter exalbidus TaxID=662960 RepID=A0A940PUT0_9MICO|nr:hypothetical protein [Leucobacter exalbidus]
MTAVVAAIEACAAAIASLAAVAIPAVVLWVVTFGIAAEQAEVVSAVAGVWLLAHFVPMELVLSQQTMLSLGVGSQALTFTLSLAPLAITLISVTFAVRAGLRLGRRGGIGVAGLIGGAVGFAAVAFAAVHVTGGSAPQGITASVITATLVYTVSATAAFVLAAATSGAGWWRYCVRAVQRGMAHLGLAGVAAFPARAATVYRLTAGACAAVVGTAAIAVTVALATGFADVIALAQALQLDVLGSVLLFLTQLALLPIAIVWSLSWLSGAGFELSGMISPFTETVGTLPLLPMFGALPGSAGSLGAIAPLLLVLANVAVGALLARRAELRRATWPVALALPVIAAVCTGLVVAGLSALATGSLGPGRLAHTGPDAWLVGGLVAAEAAVGLLIGVSVARADYSRVKDAVALPEPIARWNAERTAAAEAAARAVRPEDAETVDLSRVRAAPDATNDLGDDLDADAGFGEDPQRPVEPVTAPVVDLFARARTERAVNTWGRPDDEVDTPQWGDAGETWGADPELGDYDAFDDARGIDPDQEPEEPEAPEPLEEPEPRPAPEIFDIEAAEAAEAAAAAAQRESAASVDGLSAEESEALLRAFAWDAGDAEPLTRDDHAGRSQGDTGPITQPRGRFKLPGWRRPKE